jgi:hypothetical protein
MYNIRYIIKGTNTEVHREGTEFHRDIIYEFGFLCVPLWSSGFSLCKFLINLPPSALRLPPFFHFLNHSLYIYRKPTL